MKQLRLISFATLLLFIFCFAQCNKNTSPPPDNPYGLPNATQTGAGIFACRINGVNCIAKDDIFHQGGGIYNDSVLINGRFLIGDGPVGIIVLGMQSNAKTNITYDFSDTVHTYGIYIGATCPLNIVTPRFKPLSGNILFTKIDTARTYKIVSGIFNMKVFVDVCNDTLNISDGRFDIGFN
ncbi:MAG: hypothetical protein LBE82_09825 [Chitinophagaceae bacterium]|jgi:hypothetical protein|nr:hypothetical protein [Chitinophagaceae bacterium]